MNAVPRPAAWAILITFCICMAASGQDKPQADNSYRSLVERIKSGDKTVDFRQMRLAYADSPDYSQGPDTTEKKKSMMEALRAKDFDGAVKNAEAVLAGDNVDMDAHYVDYVAYRELKDQEKADFHQFVLKGLLKSITDSGDGKSPKTAFQVIEVHEEYVLLHFMGIGLPKSQSLLQKDGHAYDEIKFDDPATKQEVVLFFNVDIPIKHGA